MNRPRISVLFVCTGNSCRSPMAEAILRHLANERFEAMSAGSRPAGFVHPLALATLESLQIPTEGLESKHTCEFLERPIDIVITLCDNASAECPVWPGDSTLAHWSLPDPTFAPGTEEEQLEFCKKVAQRLQTKIRRLIELPIASLSRPELAQRLQKLADA